MRLRPEVLDNQELRRLMIARTISDTGSAMQALALPWLALTSTHSALALGCVVAAERVPQLLSAPAGVLVERCDQHRLMIGLQATLLVHALLLTGLAFTVTPPVWALGVFAGLLGAGRAFDRTCYGVLVQALVDEADLSRANALNGVIGNVAMMVGPGIGGLVVAFAGEAWCFLVNALSFGVLLVTLLKLDRTALRCVARLKRAPGQLREGLGYAVQTPPIGAAALMVAIVFALGFQPAVYLPALANETLHSGAWGRGLMSAALALGGILGGARLARGARAGLRQMTAAAGISAALMAGVALAPWLWLVLLALVALGAATSTFFVAGKTVVQETPPPELRARMTALYWQAAGMAALGSPLLGWIIAYSNARVGVAAGAGGFLAAGAIGRCMLRRA